MNQKDIKIWWSTIGIFMGVFTALMAMILGLHDINLLRGSAIAALLVFVGIVIWLSFKVLTISPKAQFIIIVVLYILSAGFFLWIGTWLAPPSSAQPVKFVKYYNFESEADLEGWEDEIQLSDEHSFDGKKALKAFLPISTNQETTFYLNWQHEFEADVVIGQIYWPNQEEVNVEWAQICVPFEAWACTFISKEYGWNTFVLDLSEMKTLEGQNILNDARLPGIVLQGVLQTTNPNLESIPIYLDSMQIYVDGQE